MARTRLTRWMALLAMVGCWFAAPAAQPQATVAGTVTFADGSVAAGVDVALLRDGAVVAQTSTDASGDFLIRVPVAPGTYQYGSRFRGSPP